MLVRRAIELDRYGISPPRDFTFKYRQEDQQTDKRGQTVSRGSKTFEVLTLYGEPVQHLIARNDRPLAGEEAEREMRRYERKVRELSHKSEQDRDADTQNMRRKIEKEKQFLREIPDAYDFVLAGEESIGQRAAYKVQATPRKGAKNRTHGPQANLLRLPGTIWVDKQEGQWVKVEAEVPADLHFGVFLAAIKPGTRVTFEQCRVEENVWLPTRVSGRLVARVLVLPLQVQNTTTYFDYRKFRSESRIVGTAEQE